MTRLVLISVSGEDKPGITAAISRVLGEFHIDILDVGQAVIHNHLSLGILVSIPGDSDTVLKEILFLAHELGVTIGFEPVEPGSYDAWVGLQGRPRFILTLLARKVRAAHVAEVTRVIAASGLNIDGIVRLSGRVPLDQKDGHSKACVEFSLRGVPADRTAFRTQLMNVCAELDMDVAFQEDNIFRRHRRLIAFDMDSTLISTEVINELAEVAGVGTQVAEVTERAMRGELDFRQSLKERVALLSGLKQSTLSKVGETLPLMEGAEHLFRTLNRLGYKTAILSGGFSYFGKILQSRLGIDYVYANELEIVGIAFHAKPIVKESAEQSISTLGLDAILYLMGIRDRELEAWSASSRYKSSLAKS